MDRTRLSITFRWLLPGVERVFRDKSRFILAIFPFYYYYIRAEYQNVDP